MNKSCRTLTILLLAVLSGLAMVMRPASKPEHNAHLKRTYFAGNFTPDEFASANLFPYRQSTSTRSLASLQPYLDSAQPSASQTGGGLPLLSCIGAGMAVGGLLSVRWANRGDK